jgi:hypothetical protein
MTETPGYPDTGRSGAPENPNVETGLNQKNKEMDNPAGQNFKIAFVSAGI